MSTIPYSLPSEPCPGCNGTRLQTTHDGLRITCPVCLGSGVSPFPSPYLPMFPATPQCLSIGPIIEDDVCTCLV